MQLKRLLPPRWNLIYPTSNISRAFRSCSHQPNYAHHRKPSSSFGFVRDGRQEQRQARKRVDTLVAVAERFLKSGKRELAGTYIHGRLFPHVLNPAAHEYAIERFCALLIEYREFAGAVKLYATLLEEGFVPSARLRTRMEVLKIVRVMERENFEPSVALPALQDLFTLAPEAYDEAFLLALLDFLARDMGLPGVYIEAVADAFIESRGPEYKPSPKLISGILDLQVRSGFNDTIDKWLGVHADAIREQPKKDDDVQPYTKLMDAVTDTQTSSGEAFVAIMARMKADNVSPTTALFNVLIADQLRAKNYAKAFDIYRYLRQDSSRSPDAYTFTSLFTAIYHIERMNRKDRRKVKRPRSITPSRELFRDMLEYQNIATNFNPSKPTSIVTRSVLDIALRTFITQHDYIAAFLVLRSFAVLKLPNTARTYTIVIRHLVRRIRKDLQGFRRGRWACHMLGIEAAEIPKAREELLLHDANIVERLFELAKIQSLEVADGVEVIERGPRTIFRPKPPLGPAESKAAMKRQRHHELTTVQRLVRRAILADMEGGGGRTPSQKVSEAIATVKGDMFPDRAALKSVRRGPKKTARAL
ncbi:hypothetical protein PLICRDRAFT_170782 [Plicaturopsis crispa FD-325 SS-3]|nr:hypothetical protein PLICRDRAFT_170782 [Plicaturopsis crispa FD-325 SS-3]